MTEDITIVGSGLCGTWHLTREAEAAVRAARVVFYSDYNVGIAAHVRELNPTAGVRSSEDDEYRVGMYRPDMYRRMARIALDEASAGKGVVVLCPGSAVVVDLVTQHMLEGARDAGMRVRVLAGISSIESVLAEVGHDVSDGLQVVLAQKLVLHRMELSPTIATIVFQPAYFDTLFFLGAPRSSEGRFDALAEQLGRSFSPDAPMALVVTPTERDQEASVLWFRLASFGRLHRVLSPRHTLFIPRERAPAIDDAFAARIESYDACLSRLEVDDRGAVLQQKRKLELPDDLRAESDVLAQSWRARPRF